MVAPTMKMWFYFLGSELLSLILGDELALEVQWWLAVVNKG